MAFARAVELDAATEKVVVQIVVPDRIASARCGTTTELQAGMFPGSAAIVRSILTNDAGAIQIVCTGEQLHRIVGIASEWMLVGRLRTRRRLNVGEQARSRTTGELKR